MNSKFSDELINLFESEDSYLFDLPQRKSSITAEDRLIESFNEVQNFVEKEDRVPSIEAEDFIEATLGKRLLTIKSNKFQIDSLRPYDRFGLLDEAQTPKSLKDLFESDDPIISGNSSEIFKVRTSLKKQQRDGFEEKAERKKCKDFEKFKILFDEIQNKLKLSEKKLTYFTSIDQLVEKGFYVYEGMMLYVPEFGKIVKVYSHKQQRIRVIYENGFESNMYKRSLAQRLYEGGLVVVDLNDNNYKSNQIHENIVGYIYVLKSKSSNPKINTIKDLYKIGFTRNNIAERIKSASQDPTYLMEDVEIVGSFIVTGDYNPQKIENLIHRVFSDAAIDISVIDEDGKEVRPKEWYSVPLHVVEQVVNMINSSEIIDFIYDKDARKMKFIGSNNS
jgi:hypothetical protein